MKQKDKKETFAIKILNVLITITTILIIIVVVFIGYKVVDELYYENIDASYYHHKFMSSDYLGMFKEYTFNLNLENKKDDNYEEKKEYYAVAKYFESASLYKAYVEYGNMELANFYKEKMNEYEKEMGQLSVAKKDIFEKLELNEE